MAPKKKTDTEGQGAPIEQGERLTVPEIADGLRLTNEQLRVLDDIAAGRPVNGRTPGTREVMQAIALKAQMSVAKPRDREGEDEGQVIVGCPYCGPCACGRGE